jgi:pectin methylesterase-like acyl-CoA thioesterase
MGNRFVKPKTDRLFLADVHRRAHAALVATGKATPDELAASDARVAQAMADGDYIDVVQRLNAGEEQDMFAVMVREMLAGEKVQLDPKAVQTAKVLAYLVGWSLTDDGAPVPMSPTLSVADRLSTLRSVDGDTFREIRDAIDAHEKAVEEASTARKNGQAGGSDSNKSSASADASPAGPSTTSVN